MRYLIDTNVLVRYSSDFYYRDLSKYVIQVLEDTENRIHISTISIQEIFMLLQSGKIHVPV